jgi:hypothetical protein
VAGSVPAGLGSAADYQAAFNAVNRSVWSGCYNIIPVQLADGRKLFLTGLSWAGAPVGGGNRSASAPMIVNSALIQQGTAIVPFAPAFYDTSGYGYLLDSRALPGQALKAPQRLEPLAAVMFAQSIYVTARLSSDYTSQHLTTGDVYLLELPIATLGSGKVSIRQAVKLPATTVAGTPGMSLKVYDSSLYIGYRAGAGPYTHYLARAPLMYVRLLSQLPQNVRFLSVSSSGAYSWDVDAQATPIVSSAGSNVDIWYSSNRSYNYLYRSGTTLTISALAQRTMYRSASQVNPQSISTAFTAVADSGATGFAVQRLWDVPWAQLSSGNRLGVYGIAHTAGNAFDVSHPLTARPRFFEFAPPSIGTL